MTTPAVAPALSLASVGSPSAAARAVLRERVARLYGDRALGSAPAPSRDVTAS